MKLAEEMVRCKTHGEVTGLVDVEARSILKEWKRRLIEEALEHLVQEHYGPRWQREREPRATPWTCLECGPRDTTQVKRNGHYLRQLVVVEGVITIRVPQLRCRVCGRGVALAALFLPSRKRYWIDLDQEITKLYLSGASYRQLRYMVEKKIDSGAGLMSLWRRFQEAAQRAPSLSPLPNLRVLYLDEAYTKVQGEPYWNLLALGEDSDGKRAYLGAIQSPYRGEAAWVELLERLKIPEDEKGLTVVHDGDQAIVSAVSLVMPWAKKRNCVWHELHNVFLQAKALFPQDQQKVKEIMRAAHDRIEPSKPRTTSPLERCIKEYRRRTKPMDGFGSRQGALNFLKVWMVKENARMAHEDWLTAVLN
jgi:transposase-like protein